MRPISSLDLPSSVADSAPVLLPSTRSSSRRSSAHRAVRALLVLLLVAALAATGQPVRAEDNVHVVSTGDSLAAIAKAYSVSLTELAQSNGIADPNIIYVGQRLVIPGTAAAAERAAADPNALPAGNGYYTVQRGDALAQIAKNQGMAVNDILRLNGLTNANLIWVGQRLRVSARVDAVQPEKPDKPAVADTIYIVQPDESLEQIALDHKVSVYDLMAANGLPNTGFVWAGQKLRVNAPPSGQPVFGPAPADGVRWIEVNLTNQTLTAWQGDVAVLHTSVSTGTYRTPTVTGRFAINTKLSSQRMTGPGYDLPGVPWVMYFYSGYAIHGAYWHNNFGTPMSHGCVNMRPGEAQMLYAWADYGTEVYVHY